MDGSPAEVLIGTTKLQASFKDLNTFFLAWLIYVSIRVSSHLERAPGVILWTERLHFYVSLNYPWSGILEYIIPFYNLNQNSAPDVWLDPNPTLISHYLTLHQQPISAVSGHSTATVAAAKTGGGKKARSTNPSVPSNEMCIMFNRSTGCTWPQTHAGETCPHRHTCNVCTSDKHNAMSCPKRSSK
jgi:hypothetical protein